MPLQERPAERARDLLGEQRLAGAGLALDQQRPLERDRRVDREHQVGGGDVGVGAFEAHGVLLVRNPTIVADVSPTRLQQPQRGHAGAERPQRAAGEERHDAGDERRGDDLRVERQSRGLRAGPATIIGRISAVSIAAGTYRSARASSGGIARRAKSAMNDSRDR